MLEIQPEMCEIVISNYLYILRNDDYNFTFSTLEPISIEFE